MPIGLTWVAEADVHVEVKLSITAAIAPPCGDPMSNSVFRSRPHRLGCGSHSDGFFMAGDVCPHRLIVVMSALPEGTRPAARGTLPPSRNSWDCLPRQEKRTMRVRRSVGCKGAAALTIS